MVESFTNYQRQMWTSLCTSGNLRYYIDTKKNGGYIIRHSSLGEFLFWIFWTNNIIKTIYIFLTYHSLLGVEVHYLDQMSIWDYFFMTGDLFAETIIWVFKYPLYENFYRQWELQEDIYRKLGRPSEMARKITKTDRINNYLYRGVCVIGTFSLVVQFMDTPKDALNTYAMIKEDTMLLRIIFCVHECVYMLHGYFYQAFTMVMAQSFAVSYQHVLEEMNQTLDIIIEDARRGESRKSSSQSSETSPLNTAAQNEESSNTKGTTESGGESRPVSKTKQAQVENKLAAFSTTKPVIDPNKMVPGTEYNIKTLVDDYKKIMISAQFHNQWVGLIMGFDQMFNFFQFVSDVFMMIQLLKEEDSDYWGVFFYVMDAIFGMIILFRMLIVLSRLYPQGEEFIQRLKLYASLKTPYQKQLLKTIPTLKVISAKLTGYAVRPESVPIGFDLLINWYIAAAMYQRPSDPSRRT